MPVVAHIMLALVYVTASALGAVALSVNGIVPPVTAAIIGATSALAMIQIHMAVSRMGGDQEADRPRRACGAAVHGPQESF
jgi:4-hydroxybenzoate polyprenyltransferase